MGFLLGANLKKTGKKRVRREYVARSHPRRERGGEKKKGRKDPSCSHAEAKKKKRRARPLKSKGAAE